MSKVVVEVQHTVVIMEYGRTTNRIRCTFLKRRKDSFDKKWHYFKRGHREPWSIITREEYETILDEKAEQNAILEEALIKKLKWH